MLPVSSSLRQLSARIPALPWRLALPWLVAALVVTPLTFSALKAAWHFTIDDSGISFAYAKHIAQGEGAVAAIGGPRIEGYSNALWVFLLIPFYWLSLPLPLVSKVLGVIGLLLTLWAGTLLLLRARPKQPIAALLATFWTIGMVVTLEIAVWTVAGLENALLSALLMGVVYFDVREHDDHERFPVSAVLAFLLCITRPEGPAYALPVLALKAVFAWRQKRLRVQLKRALIWFLTPLLVYHVVHFVVFHEFVPNTYFAKPQSRSLSKGLQYLHTGLKDSRLLYVLPLAVLGVLRQWRAKIILAWIVTFGCLFVLYSGGDWMPHARFISFFAPALLLLATFGVYNTAQLLATSVRGLFATPFGSKLAGNPSSVCDWITVCCLLVATAACGWGWQNVQLTRLRKVKQAQFCHFCQRLDDSKKLESISQSAQLGTVSVLTHDFGGPSWASNRDYYPIDFLGLCDATIPRLRNAKDSLRRNYPLFAHLLHEQGNGPSWIYLPRNFWTSLKDVAEHQLAYFHLSPRQLPHGPHGGFLELHRHELVDFFPPFITADWQTLGPGIRLLGSTVTTTPDATEPTTADTGATVRISFAVTASGSALGGQLGIALEEEAPKQTIRIDRGLSGLTSQLSPGEPLRFDFDVKLPEARGEHYKLRLGYSKVGGPGKKRNDNWTYVELPPLAVGTLVPLATRTLSRYPSALPSPSDQVLVDLEQAVATLMDLPLGAATAMRETLATKLIARGKELDDAHPKQAYLAYVWATNVHPPAWAQLSKPLLRLRPSLDIADFSLEILLLRDYYSNPSNEARARLTAYYDSRKKRSQAKYFAPSRSANQSEAAAPSVFTFEQAELEQWTGSLKTAGVVTEQLSLRTARPGNVLTSALPVSTKANEKPGAKSPKRHAAQGELLSPPFRIEGSKLTLLVGGGKTSDRVGVELLVDDQVVLKGSGSSEADLFPLLWDVSTHVGKSARLKVFDRSPRKSIHVGAVEQWK